MPSQSISLIPAERIEQAILLLRGQKVMLDSDLAYLYGVETKVLNQAVKRNRDRFPKDFMIQLNRAEIRAVQSYREIMNLRSQFVTSSWGGRRHTPYAFTEQGVAMLSSVLKSPRAVQVNIAIMRAFVRLRELVASNRALARHLAEMERKYDKQFAVVFDIIRKLTEPSKPPSRPIGFGA